MAGWKKGAGSWRISWEEYRELYYFCLQYDRKKADAAALLAARDEASVRRRARLLGEIAMIEAAAGEAAEDLAPYLLRAVTHRNGLRQVKAATGVPCGINQFYAMRRKFYYILHELRVCPPENR